MRLTSTELEELSHLLAREQEYGPLDEDDQKRLRELLSRERSMARTMDRDQLVRFGRLVVGLWFVRRTAQRVADKEKKLADV